MRILVWQWGRRGAGPRYAAQLAASLDELPDVTALLSLSTGAELLAHPDPPACALPVRTYAGAAGLLGRALTAPFAVAPLAARLRALRPDVAICAMPAPLDLLMAAALRRAHIPFVVAVHDAELHPGDGFPLQMRLQRCLMRKADGLVALSAHVTQMLQRMEPGRPVIQSSLPPLIFGHAPPPLAHDGPVRLLSFGRLLPYKGLDLLADTLVRLGPRPDMELRVVGSGPETPFLDTLRRLPGVHVENRWVPEAEVGALLAWADALVLSHREASQSGVAAAALASARWVIGTRVGGITGQLEHTPLGILAEPDAASLAETIARFLDSRPPPAAVDDPRLKWGEMARALVETLEKKEDCFLENRAKT